VAGVDEVLDVQHPADRDGRVARPRGDPAGPGVGEPGRLPNATRA
jgi:hypothetical protein